MITKSIPTRGTVCGERGPNANALPSLPQRIDVLVSLWVVSTVVPLFGVDVIVELVQAKSGTNRSAEMMSCVWEPRPCASLEY